MAKPVAVSADATVKINNENLSIDVKDIDEKEISFSDKDNSNDNLFENFSQFLLTFFLPESHNVFFQLYYKEI